MYRTLFALATLLALSACGTDSLEKKAARIHRAAYTVDSHTDTPLALDNEGFDFGLWNDARKTRSKIDLPRMKAGGMDGIWFAVFVGQGARSDSAHLRVRDRAYSIIDDIEHTVERFPEDLEIATDAAELKRIADKDKHAIFIGMENGYPIGTRVDLLDSFYVEGVRYVTLVHSKNNEICDSSTDSLEHGGLSAFGEEVVARMNDLGILIDLSHASDSAFWDVMEASRAPVIASHSCARALCESPRNLNDSMLLALKENGGVIQLCLLSEYLKTPEPNPGRDSARAEVWKTYGNYYELDEAGKKEFIKAWHAVDETHPRKLATVSDAVDHIDHIVELIGIGHVGIGSDFDGGGALEDCYDVSEMGNITLELLRRGYSRDDIFRIWGGNLTRVFSSVEQLSAQL